MPRREAAEPRREPAAIDDRLVRAIGIPAFGLAIPHVTGLFAGVAIGTSAFWVGTGWFLALSAAIWHGNRWLLLEQRRHWDWFDHPVRKIVMLMAAIVLFTAPLTVTMLAGWYAWRGVEVVWPVVQTVVLANVICVVFVTHVYETVFLIKERADDRLRTAELDRARTRAELDAFLAQVDPHFLFNSLNTLGYLIDTAPARAAEFTTHLAELMRYVLSRRGAELVPIAEELAFVDEFVALMQIRFGGGLAVTVVDEGGDGAARVPPTAIQTLVDNAIKHNETSEERPLAIVIRIGAAVVSVENERRPRRTVRASAGVGLRNLDERVRLTSGQRLTIDEGEGRFVVRVPLALPMTSHVPGEVSS
jgi:hypothetical protein